MHASLALIAGVQTSRGVCLPISRQGARHLIEDALQEASFEQAPMVFLRAAMASGGVGVIQSPSSAMLLAQPTRGFGTSAVDVVADVSALLASTAAPLPSVEETVDALYPLPDTALPVAAPVDAGSETRSPLVAYDDEFYATLHGSMPPTAGVELVDAADELEIDTRGTFSPQRGRSPAAESDDESAPSSPPLPPALQFDTANLAELAAALAAAAAPVPRNGFHPHVEAYDPLAPSMAKPVGGRRLRPVYEPGAAYAVAPPQMVAPPIVVQPAAAVEQYDPEKPAITWAPSRRHLLARVDF